jgi:hypothetical protein
MMKRLARWMLFIVACLVTLVALFYAEENWRGKHAWETYKREREARGDSFEWSAIAPPPVPDNENLAAIPLFTELYPKPSHPTGLSQFALPSGCTNKWGTWRFGTMEDLSGWPGCFSNTDLRTAMSKYEPILHQITEASHRPYCRFPIRYEDNWAALLPHLNAMRNLARVYRLRALMELSANETGAALEDIETCLRLVDRLKSGPRMILFWNRMAMLDFITQPVWEGLVAHRWNDSQLTALQDQFEKIDQFQEAEKSLQDGRIVGYHVILRLCHDRSRLSEVLPPHLRPDVSHDVRLLRIMPTGWFYQNQRNMDRLYTAKIFPALDWQQHRVSPAQMRQIQQSIRARRVTPYNFMLLDWGFADPFLFIERAALSQAYVDETVVACALERYRLAHGLFPETLDALVPQFIGKLPNDVIDGQPLHYKRLPGDQYLLYSIGWNEKDDGGQIAMTANGVNQNIDEGDWVWFSQPQPQPAAKGRK